MEVSKATRIMCRVRTAKCPICGREFVPAPLHSYKVRVGSRYRLACTYSCMRAGKQGVRKYKPYAKKEKNDE